MDGESVESTHRDVIGGARSEPERDWSEVDEDKQRVAFIPFAVLCELR